MGSGPRLLATAGVVLGMLQSSVALQAQTVKHEDMVLDGTAAALGRAVLYWPRGETTSAQGVKVPFYALATDEDGFSGYAYGPGLLELKPGDKVVLFVHEGTAPAPPPPRKRRRTPAADAGSETDWSGGEMYDRRWKRLTVVSVTQEGNLVSLATEQYAPLKFLSTADLLFDRLEVEGIRIDLPPEMIPKGDEPTEAKPAEEEPPREPSRD